jgi:DNA-binding LacI/PurR family transcriptional regulator
MQEVISNRYQSAQGKRIALYRDVQVHVDNESFQQLWTDVKQHRLAGLILVGGHGAIFDMEDWFSPSMPGVGFTLEHLPNQTNRPGRGFLHLDIAGFRARALDYLIARGSRNIAVIAQPYEPHLRPITGEMTQRGLQVRDHWILRTAMEQPQCAHDLARLLFSQDDRPDGLIIMDDNLVESTVAGIVDARVVVPDQLKIVAHCNWPIPSTQLLPCTMLGFEAAEFLDYAIQTIDALRQQRKDLPATLIKPRFADERITNRPG